MELCGVALFTEEDTSDAMTECFVEEFMRLGHGPAQILALFRNPHYTGPNMVFQNRGEDFVRAKVEEVFGWWGGVPRMAAESTQPGTVPPNSEPAPEQSIELEPGLTDPGGAPVPRLRF